MEQQKANRNTQSSLDSYTFNACNLGPAVKRCIHDVWVLSENTFESNSYIFSIINNLNVCSKK